MRRGQTDAYKLPSGKTGSIASEGRSHPTSVRLIHKKRHFEEIVSDIG